MGNDIADLIRHGETSRVQFKLRFTTQKEIAREMAAFANCEGGVIIFGVEDKTGSVSGLSYSEIQETSRELANAANEQVKPQVYITTDVADTDGGMVLICRIPEGRSKPYKDIGGTIWIKQGADKRRVTENSEILGLFQNSDAYKADLTGIPETSVSDLDTLALNGFFENVYHRKISEFGVAPDKLLRAARITDKEGRLTAAGLLFFGSYPQLYLPWFTIKAVAFRGNDIAGTDYDDSRDIEGTIPAMFREGMHWVKSFLRRPQNGKGFNSTGDLEIPEPVLEELLQNALVHIDLLKPAAIRLLVFSDRVEIINPGCLPGNQTVDEIKLGNSHPRNFQLANFCAKIMPYRGLGSGIPRACAMDSSIEFVNSKEGNQFKAIIRRIPSENVPDKTENVPNGDKNVPDKSENVPNGDKNVPDKSENAPNGDLNIPSEILDALSSAGEKEAVTSRWKTILSFMKQDNTVSTMDIAAKLNVSDKTVKRDIQSMNSFIRVQWIGSRRYGHWEIAAV